VAGTRIRDAEVTTQDVVSVDQAAPLSEVANGAPASGERNIMYQKILLAVDGSDASKRAEEEAFRIAALARARVHALYVVSKWGLAPYAGYYEPEALGTVLREDGRLALEAVRAAMAERGIAGDIEIDETQNAADDIPSCLERCIQREKIDLVVMGTHGRRGASRIVLGSVAEGLLRISTCPVLLVRSPGNETAQGGQGAHD
jgi:nucleotide-binding universal stress UspA family protein